MLCPRYDESSCQSYELLYHLIGPEKNVKSLKDSGWSPFLSKISSVFEVFLPMIPIQTLIRRLSTKANISYYCWTLITSNRGWIEVLRMKKEGEKYRETQVSRTRATCRILIVRIARAALAETVVIIAGGDYLKTTLFVNWIYVFLFQVIQKHGW